MAELSLDEVIEAFYICRTGDFSKCKDCPYEYKDSMICNVHRNDDALEYLKELRQSKEKIPAQYDYDNFVTYCQNCGNTLDGLENFCPKCGRKIKWDAEKDKKFIDLWNEHCRKEKINEREW